MKAQGFLSLFLLALSFPLRPGLGSQVCPPGMVFGGRKCEWPEVCPNGQPNGPEGPPCRQIQLCPDGKPPANGLCGAPARPCDLRAILRRNSGEAGRGRRVLLVGGDSEVLWSSYLDQLRKNNVEIDLDESEVLLFEKEKLVRIKVKMDFGSLFGLKTLEQLWQERLRGKKASDLPQPEKQASVLNTDVICAAR